MAAPSVQREQTQQFVDAFRRDVAARNSARGSNNAKWLSAQAMFDKANATSEAAPTSDWDRFWRPAGQVINALSSLGGGIVGAAVKSQNRAQQAQKEGKSVIDAGLEQIGAAPGDFLGSFSDTWNGNRDAKTGSDLIENTYKMTYGDDALDRMKHNNQGALSALGLVTDVGTDPLSYLPGGAISKTLKGAGKGAVDAARAAGDATKVNDLGQVVGDASDLAKTAAMPRGAAKGAVKGFTDWVAEKEANTASRRARTNAIQNQEFDEAPQYTAPNAVPAQQVDAKLAEKAAADQAKAADEAARVQAKADAKAKADAEAEAYKQMSRSEKVSYNKAKKAAKVESDAMDQLKDSTSTTAETALRGQVAQESSAGAAAAALPPTSADVVASLRRLTHTAEVHSAPLQRKIRDLKPLDAALPAPAKQAWHEEVKGLVGPAGAKQLSKIDDETEFARQADAIAASRVEKAHTDSQKASQIIREMGSARRTYNDDDLKNIGRMLGLTGRDLKRGESYQQMFKRKNVQGRLNEMVRKERQQQKAFIDAGIPDGSTIEKLAETTDAPSMAAAASGDLLRFADSLPPGRADELSAMMGRSLNDALGDPAEFKKTGLTSKRGEPFKMNMDETKAVLTHTWEQHKTWAFYKKAVNDAAEKANDLKLTGSKRNAFIADRVNEAIDFLDLRLKSLGITPVAAKAGEEAMRFGTGKTAEYAFLGLSDIRNALGRDFTDPFLFNGVSTAFPVTTLMDAARYALKEAGSETSKTLQLTGLVKNIRDTLRRGVGVGTKAKDYYLSAAGKPAIALLATRLMEDGVIEKLAHANIQNGAVARAVVGTQAHRMAAPVAEAMQAILKLPSGTPGSDIDAVLEAGKNLTNAVNRSGMTGSDAARLADWDLDLAMAHSLDTGQMLQVKAAQQMDDATVKGPHGERLPETTARRLEDEASADAGRTNASGAPVKPRSAPRTPSREKVAQASHAAANTARADEVTNVKSQIEELADILVADAKASGAEDVTDSFRALDSVRADLTMGLPNWLKSGYRGATKMSGGFGFRDLKVSEIAAEMSTRKATDLFSTNIDGITKVHGDENFRAAWNVLRGANSNEEVEAILNAGTGPAIDAARDLWPVMKNIFDHSEHNLFRRVGYSSDYINDFLRKVGVEEPFWLTGNRQSWEIGRQWKLWDFSPEDNPADIMKRYVNAMNQASVAPTIAASFSSEFGHLSTTYGGALSKQEALSQGWKKLDPKAESGIGRWVDPEQYYPPEMVSQLSMLDQYLNTSRILDGNNFFDKAFRYIDPVINMMKTSITLWRPGHHVTNIIGEGLMNTLAGVWDPRAYANALAVMKSGGVLEGEAHTGLNKLIAQMAPEGMQLKNAENLGQGVRVVIGGKVSNLSYDSVYRMLDQAGILIHHHVAEDLLNESMDLYKTGSKLQERLQRAQKTVAPKWLGELSANRDNVFRVAHAVDLLSKKSYKSVPDAMQRIAKEIHSFHPNMQTLSAFEQKYVRRLIYFYTWQRQALSRIVESLVDTPGRVTAASKLIYNVSEANGAEPESFGHPMPNDPRLPSYLQGNINSFLWNGPQEGTEADPDFVGPDGDSFLWSASINAPQLDILQTLLGGVSVDPEADPGTNIGGVAGQLATGVVGTAVTPAFRVPAELATRHKVDTGVEIKDPGAYLLDQTGLAYPRKIGLLGPQSDDKEDPREEQAARETGLTNWLLGARVTNNTTPANQKNAQREQSAYQKALLDKLLAQQGQ